MTKEKITEIITKLIEFEEKITEISTKLIEFARYIEQRAELNEDVVDSKYQYYYEQLLEIQDDLSEMQNAWWSTKSN